MTPVGSVDSVSSRSVVPVGPEAAEEVLGVVRAAFGARPPLDPPANAAAETVETIRARLESHGGLLAEFEGTPAGAMIFELDGDTMFLRRFGVVPEVQGKGVAGALVEAALEAARASGATSAAVLAREELPASISFWERHGFARVDHISPFIELRRPLDHVVAVPDAESMHELGARIGSRLRAGDLVLLIGGLGAGKTTFTQGLGAGLGVRGPVTSPTFVISRVHPSEVGGPALVHVDAYRLSGLEELDDLDLDASLDAAVTVVEWGEGVAEALAESRLEVRIERSGDIEDEEREVRVHGLGPRWIGATW